VATYIYRDAQDRPVVRVDRCADKSFVLYGYERGTWVAGLNGATPPLYKLPELRAAGPEEMVFIPEGEKDVGRLIQEKLTATTNAMGAGKWRDEHAVELEGRHVVILADNDRAGEDHARDVARSLRRHDAKTVRVITFGELRKGSDVSDWLDAGHTVNELMELAQKTPLYRSRGKDIHDLLGRTLPPLRMVIPDILPEGTTIFGGRTKMGKSQAAAAISVAVATGGKVFGWKDVEQGWVLFLGLEDSERRLQDRFGALLGDTNTRPLLEYETAWRRLDEGGLDDIEDWLIEHPDARLVVVDILQKVRRRQAGRNAYAEDYEALEGLIELANTYHVAMLIVHHLNQRSETDDPMDLLSGTEGLPGSVDTAWILKRTRGEADGVLHVYGRDIEDQELALKVDDVSGGWALIGPAHEYAVTKERRMILGALPEKAEDALGPTEIVGKSAGPVKKLLREMLADGQVAQPEYGKYVKVGNSGNLVTLPDLTPKNGHAKLPETTEPGNSVTLTTAEEAAKVTELLPALGVGNFDTLAEASTGAESYQVTGVTDFYKCDHKQAYDPARGGYCERCGAGWLSITVGQP
jgi:hypothetical protein